jgi:hypothetical protein
MLSVPNFNRDSVRLNTKLFKYINVKWKMHKYNVWKIVYFSEDKG